MLSPTTRMGAGMRAKRWLAIVVVVALVYKFLSVLVALMLSPGYRHHPVPHSDINHGEQRATLDLSCSANPLDESVWSYSGGSAPFLILARTGPLHVEAGQPVCVRVVVPPAQVKGESARISKQLTHLFQPVAGSPMHWDSIVLDAVGRKTGVSVPIHLHPVQHLSMVNRDSVHVYEAQVMLYDSDTFTVSGLLEYRDAMWNYEQTSKIPAYVPETISADLEITLSVPRSSPYHLSNYARLPECQRADVHGRWHRSTGLPFAPAAYGLPVVGGRVWLPYKCRLRGYTYSEFLQCLDVSRPLSPDRGEPYTIHWFGDTNSRRALKKITSLGDWCSGNSLSSARCQCDDSSEGFGRFTGQNKVRDSLIHLNDEDGGWSVSEDGQSRGRTVASPQARIHYHRWEGLTAFNHPPWQRAFGSVGKFHRADLVILSLVNLDASFGTFLEYTNALDELVGHLRSHYADMAIVLRTPQYFCCRAPSGAPLRRMQKDRNRLFYEYTHRLLKHHFGSQLHVWDAGGIAEALPLEERRRVSACGINAVPADIVHVENLQLINGLCNLPSVNRVDDDAAAELA